MIQGSYKNNQDQVERTLTALIKAKDPCTYKFIEDVVRIEIASSYKWFIYIKLFYNITINNY